MVTTRSELRSLILSVWRGTGVEYKIQIKGTVPKGSRFDYYQGEFE